MELLTKVKLALGGLLLSAIASVSAASVDGAVLRDGLKVEVIYDGSAEGNGSLKISQVSQMAIDPTNGELYFGNDVPGDDDYIMIVNPSTGDARKFPFYGNGMAFTKDGSKFYFGLVNLMLGVWNRDVDEYRKFTILPGVEAVHVVDDGSAKGRLLVANSDYGKNILGVDSVWEVDQGDGYYSPVMKFNEGSLATGVNFAALDAMAVDGGGNIHTLTGQGKVLILKPDGSYAEGNSSPVTSSGLMQGGLASSPDGIVYLQDTASGEIFATLPDGAQVMVGYGDPFEQTNNITDGSIGSDGQSIYAVNSQGKILRIYASDGASLLSVLQRDLGNATLNGTITDGDGVPLQGVSVRLRDKSVAPVTTDAAGNFSFNVKAGLYHVEAKLANYGDFNSRVTAIGSQSTDLGIAMSSFLPGYLPPGLTADIIATVTADSIAGSSDVSFDIEGDLYSLNHSNGTITKTVLDGATREVVQTFVAAKGGGISNAWAVAIGDDLNMYASSSNSGLLRLPPADPASPSLLTVDADNPGIVRDQNGVDRIVSFVTDIDGAAKMSNGDIMFTSGSGGSIIDGFPEGTIDSLIRYNPSTGDQTLFSRGIDASGAATFNNPDVLKVDQNDVLYVTNKGGNVVTVDATGVATLQWPGDGAGYPQGLSSYTAISPDYLGNNFLKGVDSDGVSVLRLIDPNNDHNLLLVASHLSPASGFGGFEFDPMAAPGSSVVLSEWNFLLRIRTIDGRSIADNIVNPPPLRDTVNPGPSLSARPEVNAQYISQRMHQELQYPVVNYDTVALPSLWTFARHGATSAATDTAPEPTAPQQQASSGGGAIYWLLVLAGMIGVSRRRL